MFLDKDSKRVFNFFTCSLRKYLNLEEGNTPAFPSLNHFNLFNSSLHKNEQLFAEISPLVSTSCTLWIRKKSVLLISYGWGQAHTHKKYLCGGQVITMCAWHESFLATPRSPNWLQQPLYLCFLFQCLCLCSHGLLTHIGSTNFCTC